MPKVYILATFLITFGYLSHSWATLVFAQPLPGLCNNPNIQTDPTPLKNNDSHAEFIVDVNRDQVIQDARSAGKQIVQWKAEFQCGTLGIKKEQKLADPSPEPGNTNIRFKLDQGGLPVVGGFTADNRCEFDPKNNPITVLIKAVLDNNGNGRYDEPLIPTQTIDTDVPFCRASYLVYEADTFCELAVNPTSGIIFGQTLEVNVKQKATTGAFDLFIDDHRFQDDVQQGSTSTYQLPQDRLTLSEHRVSLRKQTFSIRPLIGSVPDWGPPICPLSFRVGTRENPGSVISITTGTSAHIPCPPGSQCSSSVVDKCSISGQQGIPTAIGCIPTEPVPLTRALLKFVVAISGGIAFLLMVFGAFGMITSAGNPEALEGAKDRFTKAIIGLLTVVFAVLLLKIIGVDILGLGAFLGV